MAEAGHIRNPMEWSADQLRAAGMALNQAGHSVRGAEEARQAPHLAVRRIDTVDLKDILRRGFADFVAYRTDVVLLCIIYPLAGLILARLAFGYDLLPLIFPLASGFALIGPIAAVGLYEMSRRREQGHEIGWADAFGVVRRPAFGAVLVLGLILLAVLLLWLGVAHYLYQATLGPEAPASIGAFARDLFTTAPGWTLVIAGIGIGFCFALLVLTISVVSFPMLLDRDVGLYTAIGTSMSAVATNPVPMAIWGLIVAGGLVLGSIPALLGLVIVLPVLGHATWHLYRKVVVAAA